MTILLFGPLNGRITFLNSQKNYLTIQESCIDVTRDSKRLEEIDKDLEST